MKTLLERAGTSDESEFDYRLFYCTTIRISYKIYWYIHMKYCQPWCNKISSGRMKQFLSSFHIYFLYIRTTTFTWITAIIGLVNCSLFQEIFKYNWIHQPITCLVFSLPSPNLQFRSQTSTFEVKQRKTATFWHEKLLWRQLWYNGNRSAIGFPRGLFRSILYLMCEVFNFRPSVFFQIEAFFEIGALVFVLCLRYLGRVYPSITPPAGTKALPLNVKAFNIFRVPILLLFCHSPPPFGCY